jgi:hypothetical protein
MGDIYAQTDLIAVEPWNWLASESGESADRFVA